MLPKAPSAAQTQASLQAQDIYHQLQLCPDPVEAAVLTSAFLELVRRTPLNASLVRLDAIVTRDDGALLLVDQSTVHSTSPSYRKETLRSLCVQLTQHLRATRSCGCVPED